MGIDYKERGLWISGNWGEFSSRYGDVSFFNGQSGIEGAVIIMNMLRLLREDEIYPIPKIEQLKYQNWWYGVDGSGNRLAMITRLRIFATILRTFLDHVIDNPVPTWHSDLQTNMSFENGLLKISRIDAARKIQRWWFHTIQMRNMKRKDAVRKIEK